MGRENRTGVFELPQDPEIPDLFRTALRNLQLSMRTHTVATVVAYNAATQKADVTVDILGVVKDNLTPPSPANPNPTTVQKPITLKGIPVAWPRTNQGYLTFPLTPGTKGELHVQDRSLEAWLSLGTATDPVAAWAHNLADSVFHPHVFNDANPITPPTSLSHAVLEGPLIALGAIAATVPNPVLKGLETTQAMNTYTTAVAAAYSTWLAATAGGTAPTAVANGAFIFALGAANGVLLATITGWLSTKVFTE
jgi:hypothetical protein